MLFAQGFAVCLVFNVYTHTHTHKFCVCVCVYVYAGINSYTRFFIRGGILACDSVPKLVGSVHGCAPPRRFLKLLPLRLLLVTSENTWVLCVQSHCHPVASTLKVILFCHTYCRKRRIYLLCMPSGGQFVHHGYAARLL